MPLPKTLLNRIFRKFYTGKANTEERSLFWRWIWSADVNQTKASWTEADEILVKERLWANILSKTGTAPTRKAPVWRPYLAAAILMGVLLSGWLLMRPGGHQSRLAANSAIVNNGNAVRYLTLPDGTKVILNIHSVLEYSISYNDRERRVYLKGEGYFTVHKDDKRPFIVQSGQIETRALGTALNIESREGEGQIRVALTEGKIAVSVTGSDMPGRLLSPGQILFYDKANQGFTTTHYSTDVTAWTRGGLVFNGIPLTEALDRMADRYLLEVQYDRKKLSGRTITASFGSIGWQAVLANISLLHDLTYHVRNNKIIIE